MVLEKEKYGNHTSLIAMNNRIWTVTMDVHVSAAPVKCSYEELRNEYNLLRAVTPSIKRRKGATLDTIHLWMRKRWIIHLIQDCNLYLLVV